MRRRTFLLLAGVTAVCVGRNIVNASATDADQKQNLLVDPLEVTGAWKWPQAAASVLVRMRDVCLSGVRLVSDRQPDRIVVDDHTSGPPAIWLHDDNTNTAWIIVDVAGSLWDQMCYQFGHELGHVLSNSWAPEAKPQPPCQWLEEALVEAFSLRGLGLLASIWERDPPFEGDANYAKSIHQYREALVGKYRKIAADQGDFANLSAWFGGRRRSIETQLGLDGDGCAAIPDFLVELEKDNDGVEALGALNRWPQRTSLPIDEYLSRWEASCAELNASPKLPIWLRNLLLGR